MVAQNLINIARSRLGDVKKQRWTDDRLMQILNQGQASICKLTGIFRKETVIALGVGQIRYILPLDCMTIRRLEYNDEVIPLFSRNDIDEGQAIPGEFVGLKDNVPMGAIEIYPTLTELATDAVHVVEGSLSEGEFIVNPEYGVTTGIDVPYELGTPYGVLTSIDFLPTIDDVPTIYGEVVWSPLNSSSASATTPTAYGVAISAEFVISDDEKLFGFITDSDVYAISGKFGVTTDVIPVENTLKVYYEAVPTDLVDLGATLAIPDLWEEAMGRYIVGTALQDDNDAGNIQRGELELQKFNADIMKARELSSKDFSGGMKDKYNTRFRRI